MELKYPLKLKEHPGYLGKKRDEIYKFWDEQYGKDKWIIVYELGPYILTREEGILIYEDAYFVYLKSNQEALNWLTSTACDVYDTAPTNIFSKYDYSIQETPNNHLHDIAIRRALRRLGEPFRGNHIVQVRGKGSEGEQLSPHLIPFHLPNLIYQSLNLEYSPNMNFSTSVKDYTGKGRWWDKIGIPNSVEKFYQHNKILILKEDIK